MNAAQIIIKHYPPDSLAYHILFIHSQAVARKAVKIAIGLNLVDSEIGFIHDAALLHDIGILFTKAPEIGCYGDLPYICHGFKGHDLLLSEGLPRHALVCERHTGTGLSLADIDHFGGILPRRPMEPLSLSEKLIAYSDKFFSKDPERLDQERTFADAIKAIAAYGDHKVKIFNEWHRQFNP